MAAVLRGECPSAAARTRTLNLGSEPRGKGNEANDPTLSTNHQRTPAEIIHKVISTHPGDLPSSETGQCRQAQDEAIAPRTATQGLLENTGRHGPRRPSRPAHMGQDARRILGDTSRPPGEEAADRHVVGVPSLRRPLSAAAPGEQEIPRDFHGIVDLESACEMPKMPYTSADGALTATTRSQSQLPLLESRSPRRRNRK